MPFWRFAWGFGGAFCCIGKRAIAMKWRDREGWERGPLSKAKSRSLKVESQAMKKAVLAVGTKVGRVKFERKGKEERDNRDD
ncbi:hypothetical protein RHSIM_Rhsim02G0097200 [Rhododendron simsii]|uniref:Uncharacterized protein n=1 Tax=Rhododendron simsii TaxID=118357 RepID=A0A834HDR1_RHOSS|nr:hypothetical protein RHSIM_Rhsim02G0097200 [Rhododendron simsii]